MVFNEPIYDLDVLTEYNLHVHSTYSGCAKPEMKVADILIHAKNSGIKMLAFTDHFNSADAKILEHNEDLRKQVEALDMGLKVIYGAELSAYGKGKWLDSDKINKQLDYRLYSHNHYHLDFWEHPEEKTPRGYTNHALEVLETLFRSKRADCIAHPFIGRFIRCFEDRTLVTKEISDFELGEIMKLAKDNDVAWELNVNSIIADPVFGKRFWNIGKEVGVVFNLGTDAHRLQYIDTKQYLDQLKKILGEL